MRVPTFRRDQIIRLSRLLDMMYKPGELADEIEVSADTIYRSYMPAGMPYERDANGYVWIHGLSFQRWASGVIGAKKKAPKHPMANDEAWCMKCNAVVKLLNPKPKRLNRYADLLQGRCAVCGTRVNRAVSKRPDTEKQSARGEV